VADELNPMKPLNTDKTLCGARTRTGRPCRRPKALDRSRCRLHGGAPGSGAPSGDRNGRYKEGEHTNEVKAERRWVWRVVAAAEGKTTEMKELMVPAVQEILAEQAPVRRAKPVRAKVRQVEGSIRRVAEPIHQSHAEWASALRQALGTTSDHFVEASLQRLLAASALPTEAVASTTSLSAALALIQGMEPENEAQAALAVNAACLHAACTNVISRLQPSGGDRRVIYLATAVARLERAFHSALETFYRVKRGNTQVIRVEKIEIQPGAQAIVGNVNRA